MPLQYGATRLLRSLTRQSTLARYFSLLTIPVLVLVWIYVIHNGERRTYEEHIEACAWSSWEDWPAGSTPHRLVFVADPQIVDPHTYPGRPWPLSTLTERYTDRYMRRNYQLINHKLDPDSIVFLGDLFDGGREWATQASPPLRKSQQKKLDKLKKQSESRRKKQEEEKARAQAEAQGGSNGGDNAQGLQKRSWASYANEQKLKQKMNEDPKSVRLEDHNIDHHGNDLKEFVYGEGGRWKSWGMKQWNTEYERFGKMFFAPDQLYPRTQRRTIAAWDVPAHPLNVLNGASDVSREEHAVIGGKTRRLLMSLPGNHDVGFGPRVQLAVRDRFNAHYGESNRVDILGNHSFVSIDAPSLAAYSQSAVNGQAYPGTVEEREHIWKPAMDFLNGIQTSARTAVADQMAEYYPDEASLKQDIGDPNAETPSRPRHEDQTNLPVILLTHVPLYRDPGTDCGPLRERGHAISISGGYQYQNTLTRELSNEVAQEISNAGDIVHIFSGDDHDYCDVLHRYNVGTIGENRSPKPATVPETTVKSFSWAMGVRRPGFQLLSLWNPVDANGASLSGSHPTVQTHLCLLPDQIGILIDYGKLAGFTLCLLFIRAVLIAMHGDSSHNTCEDADTLSELSLPRFRNHDSPNGSANGYSTPNKSEFKGRQRASSTGLKSLADNQHLGVQRLYNARTRSVSPAPGNNYNLPPGGLPNVPMFEKSGLYPHDPDDSDEESNVGDLGDYAADSQAKWRRKRRGLSRPRVAFNEFGKSVGIVAAFGGAVYLYRIWSW